MHPVASVSSWPASLPLLTVCSSLPPFSGRRAAPCLSLSLDSSFSPLSLCIRLPTCVAPGAVAKLSRDACANHRTLPTPRRWPAPELCRGRRPRTRRSRAHLRAGRAGQRTPREPPVATAPPRPQAGLGAGCRTRWDPDSRGILAAVGDALPASRPHSQTSPSVRILGLRLGAGRAPRGSVRRAV